MQKEMQVIGENGRKEIWEKIKEISIDGVETVIMKLKTVISIKPKKLNQ